MNAHLLRKKKTYGKAPNLGWEPVREDDEIIGLKAQGKQKSAQTTLVLDLESRLVGRILASRSILGPDGEFAGLVLPDGRIQDAEGKLTDYSDPAVYLLKTYSP